MYIRFLSGCPRIPYFTLPAKVVRRGRQKQQCTRKITSGCTVTFFEPQETVHSQPSGPRNNEPAALPLIGPEYNNLLESSLKLKLVFTKCFEQYLKTYFQLHLHC